MINKKHILILDTLFILFFYTLYLLYDNDYLLYISLFLILIFTLTLLVNIFNHLEIYSDKRYRLLRAKKYIEKNIEIIEKNLSKIERLEKPYECQKKILDSVISENKEMTAFLEDTEELYRYAQSAEHVDVLWLEKIKINIDETLLKISHGHSVVPKGKRKVIDLRGIQYE